MPRDPSIMMHRHRGPEGQQICTFLVVSTLKDEKLVHCCDLSAVFYMLIFLVL